MKPVVVAENRSADALTLSCGLFEGGWKTVRLRLKYTSQHFSRCIGCSGSGHPKIMPKLVSTTYPKQTPCSTSIVFKRPTGSPTAFVHRHTACCSHSIQSRSPKPQVTTTPPIGGSSLKLCHNLPHTGICHSYI